MALTSTTVFVVLIYSALADTIRKNIEEHSEGAKEAKIRSHDAKEEEMPSVTLRRADFKDQRTDLSAFNDRKPSVRKTTTDRDGHVIMSVDAEGEAQQEEPQTEVSSEENHVEAIICDEGHWQCKDGSGCVRHSMLCDGLSDCHDHSDEEKEACGKGNFAQILAHAAVKAEMEMDDHELKRYEILSIPGYIPPPREHYEDFYKSNFNMVKRFPRVTNPNDTLVEVWFLSAPVSKNQLPGTGPTQTGVGFIGRDKTTKEELFRRDYQYQAAALDKASGPNWLKNGDLELNDQGDRVAFRARASISSARTHKKWSPDWNKFGQQPQKMATIDGHQFNNVIPVIEQFGRDNKYWQSITVTKRKDVVQPAVTCHEFTTKVLASAMDDDESRLWEDRRMSMQRTTYEVSEHQLTRDPLRCLAPFVDPIDGVGSTLDKAHMYNARFLFSFFMGKKLTLPQRYMSDGTALEESDFPAECQEFRVKKIITQYTGPMGQTEEVEAPKVPVWIRSGVQSIDKGVKSFKAGFDTLADTTKKQLLGGVRDTLSPTEDGENKVTSSVLGLAEAALSRA
jgi:hypothetical protein